VLDYALSAYRRLDFHFMPPFAMPVLP